MLTCGYLIIGHLCAETNLSVCSYPATRSATSSLRPIARLSSFLGKIDRITRAFIEVTIRAVLVAMDTLVGALACTVAVCILAVWLRVGEAPWPVYLARMHSLRLERTECRTIGQWSGYHMLDNTSQLLRRHLVRFLVLTRLLVYRKWRIIHRRKHRCSMVHRRRRYTSLSQ